MRDWFRVPEHTKSTVFKSLYENGLYQCRVRPCI